MPVWRSSWWPTMILLVFTLTVWWDVTARRTEPAPSTWAPTTSRPRQYPVAFHLIKHSDEETEETVLMLMCDVISCSFSNLGILHVTKKGVVEVLSRRLRDERRRQKGAHCHLTGKSWSHDSYQPVKKRCSVYYEVRSTLKLIFLIWSRAQTG